jgi:tripartite-type tricarboxylate transporter receptor subunit TctC
MMIGRILVMVSAGVVAALTACWPAFAQTYPDRPIRLIAPFAAGGLADVLARALGDQLTRTLRQPIVIENRAGAGGNTGADAVAKAAPDGYTLLMSSAGILTANPFLYPSMPFDAETAFVPISNVADMSMLIVVHPKVAATTLRELVALAKTQPGKINFGSAGIGTTGHLGLAMFMHAAGVTITHVPYRGAAPAVQDLIAGQIDGVVDNPPTVISHIRGGLLRALAVGCPKCRPQPKAASPITKRRRGSACWRQRAPRPRSSSACTGRSPRPCDRPRWPGASRSPAPASSAIRRPSSPRRSRLSACAGVRSSGRRGSRRSSETITIRTVMAGLVQVCPGHPRLVC